jgi:hypothetical protein
MTFRARHLPAAAICTLFALSGCQCIDDRNFDQIPDAGTPDAGEPPEPPVFPLKAGDVLTFAAVGGRTNSCPGIEGSCDRFLKPTYTIKDVVLDSPTNTWTLNADFLYEMTSANIEATEIGELFLAKSADFVSLKAGEAANGTALFSTNAAPVDDLTPNGFPFFHFEPAYATQEGSAYSTASAKFRERVLALDADAEIRSQAAASSFEAIFRDARSANVKEHFIRVELHPFGFMCSWDERVIPFPETATRTLADFDDTPDVAGTIITPMTLVRGDQRFVCSCVTQQCRLISDQTQCLNPADPNAAPAPCPA